MEADRCSATVAYVYAPESQFATLWAERPSIGAREIPGYIDAWKAVMRQRTMQNIAANNAASQAAMATSQRNFDYVDYALGQRTVRDQSGQSVKVAAGSAVTWLSADGIQSYQSPDPNANPNGVLPGTWNRGQQTHGDGTPY
jgi:hypothetical protein